MVAGHAVVVAESLEGVDTSDQAWSLLPYQRQQDLPGTFVAHVHAGVALARADPRALLIFSGGVTRPDAGPRSEGLSYWLVAEHFGWWAHERREERGEGGTEAQGPGSVLLGSGSGRRADAQPEAAAAAAGVAAAAGRGGKEAEATGGGPRGMGGGGSGLSVAARAVVEDHARDSYENLLFSLCRFKEVTGAYPVHVTAVGYAFKRFRFEELHRRSLGWHKGFAYVGLEPPESSRFDVESAREGELRNAVSLFSKDPYGCAPAAPAAPAEPEEAQPEAPRRHTGGTHAAAGGGDAATAALTPTLSAKRAGRNPMARAVPYALSCPELAGLLSWCGPGPFPGPLPWDEED